MLVGGNNIGRIGVLQSLEKHPGSFEIAHVKDSSGKLFSTRLQNIIIIGDGKTPAISIPKGEGLKFTLMEELKKKVVDSDNEDDDEEEAADEDSDKWAIKIIQYWMIKINNIDSIIFIYEIIYVIDKSLCQNWKKQLRK